MNESLYKSQPVFAVTSDVDWASEDAIRLQQEILDRYDVHATYFMTHESPALSEFEREGRITFGIHPNFLPGSSHGDSFDEVIDTVLGLAPNARCFRSHRYFDVTDVTHRLVERGIVYDSNVCTNLEPGIAPFLHESGLVRFPTFYEDGTHMWNREGWDFSAHEEAFRTPGIKIISLHPMVFAADVKTPEQWAELKRRYPPDAWLQMSSEQLAAERNGAAGPAIFLERLLEFIREGGYPLLTMDELYEQFGHRNGRGA
jgi:hypothetical protein